MKVEKHNTAYSYNIILKETRNELGDGTCTSYPDAAGHRSYPQCVKAEAEGKVRPVLGCMPPWMSQQDRCTGPVRSPKDRPEFIQWFNSLHPQAKTGFFYKSDSCSLPCSKFSVQTIFRERRVKNNIKGNEEARYSLVNLFVDDNVQVDTLVPAVDFFTLVVEIGKYS